jgi:uncharacterized Zn-finger protein
MRAMWIKIFMSCKFKDSFEGNFILKLNSLNFNYILLQSHMDERDFICHICSKAFYRRDALKKHILCYHENVKAFHCNICNKQFKGHLPQVTITSILM